MMTDNHATAIKSVLSFASRLTEHCMAHATTDTELAQALYDIAELAEQAANLMLSSAQAGDELNFQVGNLAAANIAADLRDAAAEGREAIIDLAEMAAAVVGEIENGRVPHVVH